ncbi:acyl-CoA dehydrogenase family protein [Sinorhizobium americanum]|uniref:Alkylation response protein AidB-like acyl-CoA dehydrogenase n=1 Tax=Sinorhizobium americanum TaxID=194963 RepID=A0A4R2C2H5_9HYPH|nr:acyl-CoA dehydrogenase family protein [Sinorhizobium americanum]OAP34693.1 monooxygenase [Sinorhizobium americanum]TCN32614.1 alkylation response protein AidB-like acyl-CoA dehydrogenase [Sinorhizobium americanum]
MGSITHLHERLRPVPLSIASDEEVLTAAGELVALGAEAPAIVLADALVRSGLLAISIPSDFDGADVSNGLIAEAVSKIAEVQPAAAGALVHHYRALELVRNAGSEEQRRSIYAHVASGERLSAAGPSDQGTPRYVPDGIGFKLTDALEAACLGEPDWFAILAQNEVEASSLLLVQRGCTETHVVRTGEPALYRLGEAHVPADSVLVLNRDALLLARSLGTILQAAIVLGEKRRQLAGNLCMWRDGRASSDRPWDERIGRFQVEIETLAALIDRASTALDLAQVNSTPAGIAVVVRLATTIEIAFPSEGTRGTGHLLAELGRMLFTD